MTGGSRCVGVVVATYDRPEWLEVAIRSIQTSAAFASHTGIETRILVVDDGPDGTATASTCDRLNVRCVRNSAGGTHTDPAAARGFGLNQIDAEYHAFFDDDDVMLPRFLRLHVDAIEGGADVVHSPYTLTDADLRPIRTVAAADARLGDMLADHNPVNDYSLLRASSARGIFDAELGVAAPFGAWLELAFRGARFVKLSEPTFLYRRHSENMSRLVGADADYLATRRELVARYRQLVLNRDGSIPDPSLSLRARRAVPPSVKAGLQRLRSAARRPR